jgi:hypothetical protein
LALATATTVRTSASFRMAAAPLSPLAPAGVPSDRASQKILVVNDTFPGKYRPGVLGIHPVNTIAARQVRGSRPGDSTIKLVPPEN